MIEVRDLHKAFGAVKAVDGVSFAARDGEITGLLLIRPSNRFTRHT